MSEQDEKKQTTATDLMQDDLKKFGVDISVKTKGGNDKPLSDWEKMDEVAEKDYEKLTDIEKELMKHSEEVAMGLNAQKDTQNASDVEIRSNVEPHENNGTKVQENSTLSIEDAERMMLEKLNMLLQLKREHNPMFTFVERGGRLSFSEAMTLPEEEVENYHQAYDFIKKYEQAMLCYAISVNPYQYAINVLKSIGYQ